MILTGSEIKRNVTLGRIVIEPFNENQINPNSYNYRLGEKIGVPKVNAQNDVHFEIENIPEEGFVLEPMKMYLANTYETLGSTTFAMSLIGRSSLGRLGLFLQVSANLGHTGSCHKWTLEMVSAKPFVVYPYMKIGQISFWENLGQTENYRDGYSSFNIPQPSRAIKGF